MEKNRTQWMAIFNSGAGSSPEETLVALANRAELESVLDAVKEQFSKLHPRFQKVLSLKLGLEDGVCHDCDKIAEATGYKPKAIPIIVGKAIAQLRQIAA